jgi:fumarate reductase flavoprotein subunit
MAEEAGARLVGTENFYGHLLSQDAFTNELLWPYPYLDNILHTAVVVGPSGERFVDEGRGGVYVANAIARLPDPLSSAVVFDQAIWEAGGRQGIIAANPHLPLAGGTLLKADTLVSCIPGQRKYSVNAPGLTNRGRQGRRERDVLPGSAPHDDGAHRSVIIV